MGWERLIYTKARKNAEVRQIPFELAWEEMQKLVAESEGRCALTGIPFNFERGQTKRRPFTASLDRIDSSKGYTLNNCRLTGRMGRQTVRRNVLSANVRQ